MTGHHRRHTPVLRRAKALVDAGVPGRPVAAHGMATWRKPASYFDLPWHAQSGAGTILINLIHDIDLQRYLLGAITRVQVFTSNDQR